MADHYQIVDQIRAFVQSSDQTRNGFLESLALTYADACVEVNQRMGRCHRLLQQGLRSEAIQLADSEPKLLDVIAALDFPERVAWDEVVQIYELSAAPKLAVEQAQFLNEAYALEDPLQDLLRRHRRLALQRASLRSRIAVMRKLAAQDANNPIWVDDLRTFEKARFRQVQSEAAQAAQSHDLGALSQLLAEIEQQSWVEPPPKALIQGLRIADAQFRGQQTRAHLTDLEARLDGAFAARDPIRGRIARQEWNALTATAQLAPADPLWERVRSPLNWLEEEDRIDEENHAHETDLAAMVQALDDSGYIPPAELERLAHAVLQHGRGMSEGNQQRYIARLRTAEAAQSRRWRAIVSGIAAVVIVALSLAFYAIRSSTRTSDVGHAATAVLDMLELGEVEQAGSFLKRLQQADPGLLTYPALVEAQEKHEAALRKETDRIRAFDKSYRAAEQASVTQLNPSELETARKLARHQTEKEAIEQLVKRRAAMLDVERTKHEKDVGPRLDAVGRKIAEIQPQVETEVTAKTDVPKILGQLADTQRMLTGLGPELAYVGDNLQSRARFLDQKLEAARTRFDQSRQKAHLEVGLTGIVAYSATSKAGDLVKFASGLDDYIKSFPDDPRSRAFRQTREEQSLWYAIEAWNTLAAGWKGRRNGLSTEEAQIRAGLCGRFVAQHPSYPGLSEVARYQRHLEAIARRKPANDSPINKLQLLLSDIFVNHVWMVTTQDDASGRSITKHFYAPKEPEDKGDFLVFSSFLSFEGKEVSHSIHRDRIRAIGLSPQSELASQFNPALRDASLVTRWDTVMIDLVVAIVHKPGIDPILQVALLRKVVESAVAASEPLRESLDLFKTKLDQSGVDVNVPWMNPETPRLKQNQTEAADLIRSLPDLANARKRALALSDQIERDVARTYRTVGWLAQSAAGGWEVRTGVAVPPQGDLWVVAYQADKSGEWKKIGTITDGKPRIHAEDGSSLADGRPVFVIGNAM
jgi:hypothetical protein